MRRIIWYPGYEVMVPDVVRAAGCHVYDRDGNQYLDLESGVWCTAIGHGHPRIQQVMQQQSARISHTGFSYSTPVLEDVAGEMLALHGFDGGRCTFLSFGREAVEFAVRNVQMVQQRPLLLTMSDSYFGAYGSASHKPESEWYRFDWFRCGDAGCNPGCPHFREIPFDQIGGLVFEPGSSAGLVRFPPKSLIREMAARIQGAGGLVVVNEVTTGMGRTGKWFGYQHYDITPDVVVMGKGVGNGYPVSVAAFSPRALERMGERQLKFSQSHQNDPLGAVIAAEVVKTIHDENLIAKAGDDGAFLLEGLNRIKTETGAIREIRARGLMIALELTDDENCTFSDSVHRELLKRGYIIARRPGLNVLRIDPPLTVERSDLEKFLAALKDTLKTV